MSSFKEFITEAEKSPTKALFGSNTSLLAIKTSLAPAISGLLTPFSVPSDKKQEFAEKVSNLVRDEEFISKFSDCIGMPSELETEDEFVERGNSVLRKMLYARFGIK
jgi:surfactin synthase thioesterase subunit